MKRVVIIGQAPPREPAVVPFGRTRLYEWLQRIGIDQEAAQRDIGFAALVREFPGSKGGSHLAPSAAAIIGDRSWLLDVIRTETPIVIVPVGILAIREALLDPSAQLDQVVGGVYRRRPFGQGDEAIIIPLPHPSGANPWVHMQDHGRLLDQALEELRKALAAAR
jgi:uracil-DNA glycosylase